MMGRPPTRLEVTAALEDDALRLAAAIAEQRAAVPAAHAASTDDMDVEQ